MEYLTLDQKKKSLNCRVNDMKLDGSLLLGGSPGQGLSLLSQDTYQTTVFPVFGPSQVITLTITKIGNKVIVDVPGFTVTATSTDTGFVQYATSINNGAIKSFDTLGYSINGSGSLGRASSFSGAIIYSRQDGTFFSAVAGQVFVFEPISMSYILA
jgi:hypothetical protein